MSGAVDEIDLTVEEDLPLPSHPPQTSEHHSNVTYQSTAAPAHRQRTEKRNATATANQVDVIIIDDSQDPSPVEAEHHSNATTTANQVDVISIDDSQDPSPVEEEDAHHRRGGGGVKRKASDEIIIVDDSDDAQWEVSESPWESTTTAPPVSCPICLDEKSASFTLTLAACSHTFCQECLQHYLSDKIEGRAPLPIACPIPDCKEPLLPREINLFLTAEERNRLAEMEVEHGLGAQLMYCPNAACGMLLEGAADGAEHAETEGDGPSDCPYCGLDICAVCKVAWHTNISCEQYRALPPEMRNSDDVAVVSLAAQEGWKQCPTCRHLVQRSMGCSHMSCRCGALFCYNCGTLSAR